MSRSKMPYRSISLIALVAMLLVTMLPLAPASAQSDPQSGMSAFEKAYIPIGNGYIDVVDLKTPAISKNKIKVIGGDAVSAGINPNGKQVLLSVWRDDGEGEIAVIDPTNDEVVGSIAVGHGPASIAFSPDGTRAFVANQSDHTISIIDTARLITIGELKVSGMPASLVVVGSILYVANNSDFSQNPVPSDQLELFDTTTGLKVKSFYLDQFFTNSMSVDPTGTRLYIASYYDNEVKVLNLLSEQFEDSIEVGIGPSATEVTPDGKFLYVTNAGGNTVSAIDLDTQEVVNIAFDGCPSYGCQAKAIGITVDGKYALTAAYNLSKLFIIDTQSNTVSEKMELSNMPNTYGTFMVPTGAAAQAAPIAPFSGGDGTETNPYLIRTPEQLQNVNNYLNGYFKLDADIDLQAYLSPGGAGYNNGKGWKPIGSSVDFRNFGGVFDGGGHTISNLFIQRDESEVGLFGFIRPGGKVQNLNLVNANVQGNFGVGGLVGRTVMADLQRVSVEGKVKASGSLGNTVGGLVGMSEMTIIRDAYFRGQVAGDNYAGGLLGSGTGATIVNAYSAAAVTVSATTEIHKGALVGMNNPSSVEKTYVDAGLYADSVTGGALGKTTEAMKQQGTYVNWNFGGVWAIQPAINQGYPYLIWPGPQPEFAGGDGSAEHPYEISSAAQLDNVRGHMDKHFVLVNDIDLNVAPYNTGSGWNPIGAGTNRKSFSGTFDGKGFKIENLTINSDAAGLGLFTYLKGADIKNLELANVLIKGQTPDSEGAVGALSGFASNSSIASVQTSGEISGNRDVGGLIGQADNQMIITDSSSSVNVTVNQMGGGGLIGTLNSFNPVTEEALATLTNSYATGTVIGESNSINVGGLIGEGRGVRIDQSYATGNVTGGSRVGGLAGSLLHASIERSFVAGSRVTGISEVGGFIGTSELGIYTNTYTRASVTGETKVGGYIGWLTSKQEISYSYAAGSLTGVSSSTYGFAYATDEIYDESDFNQLYFDETVSGSGSQHGEIGQAASSDMMKNEELIRSQNWDLDRVWTIDPKRNGGYPYLRYFGIPKDPEGPTDPTGPTNPTDPTGPTDPGPTGPIYPPNPSGPVVPSNTSVDVLVNGKAESAGSAATSTRNGQSLLTIVIDEQKLESKLAAEGNGAIVAIPVRTKADVVIGELNGRMIKKMADKQAILEIRTDNATYTVPALQFDIDAWAKRLGTAVSLEDIKLQIEIAAPLADQIKAAEDAAARGKFTLAIPPVEFAVRALYKDKVFDIVSFQAYVKRTIAIPDGVDPNKITTGVVVEPDGSVRHVPTKVERIEGKYYATINSLTNSNYAVVWNPVTFVDMTHHWAQDAVNNMGSRMVLNGTGNGRFSPDLNITRAEFAAIVVRALGLRSEIGTAPFSDVSASDWYAGAVSTAQANGLINGMEDGSFRPNEAITREQAMTIIAGAMKLTGLKAKLPQQSVESQLKPFADAADSSAWAAAGIADSVQAGVVTGRSPTSLAPKASVTRAEVAAMMLRLLQKSDLI